MKKKIYEYVLGLVFLTIGLNIAFFVIAYSDNQEKLPEIVSVIALAAVMVLAFGIIVARSLAKEMIAKINQIDLKKPMEQISFPELEPLLKRIEKQNVQISRQLNDLLEQEHKFNIITQNMKEGLVLINRESKILFMSQSCQVLFRELGVSCEGNRITLFQDGEQLQEEITNALNGKFDNRVFMIQDRQIQLFANPVKEKNTITGAVLIALDITKNLKAKKQRQEFSANVTHELKTPLTSILGYAELIKTQLAAPEDIPDFAEMIYNEAARLLNLVNDIIQISRLDEGNIQQPKEQVNLYKIAQEVIRVLESAAKKYGVLVTLQGESVYLVTVYQIMYDMLYNLCENAIKYNKPNGSVKVIVQEEEGHPVITVSDTGIGIPLEHQERIFERFYRIDKSHARQTGGTGLGLSIVKHAAEFQGGYIEIHSNKGEGTTIKVHL